MLQLGRLRSSWSLWLLLTWITTTLGFARVARANTFDTFGFDPRAISMGGAQTADTNDFTGVFYNPSRLSLLKQVNVGLGFTYERPGVTVTPTDPSQQVTTLAPPDFANYTIGFVYPFGGKVQDKLAIGLGLGMPVRNLLRVQSVDPNTANWYLLQSSPDRIQIFLGVGIRPFDWLAIGFGAQMLSDFGGDVEFKVDLFNKEFQERDITNDLVTRASPVAGLTIIPIPQLHIGFNWRAPMELDYDLPNHINLGDLGALFLDVHGVTFYTPHEFTFGVHYDPTPALTISGDLQYALWSKAPNPAAVVTVRITGDLEKGLGLDQATAMNSNDPSTGFQDILIPRLGIEYRIGERFAARLGYFYRPTMIPKQNGTTNLLDASENVLSAGIGGFFPDPLEILSSPIEIDLAGQLGLYDTRQAVKPVNGPVPSYSYGGQYELFTVAVRYNFGEGPPPASKPVPPSDDEDKDKSKGKEKSEEDKDKSEDGAKSEDAVKSEDKPKAEDKAKPASDKSDASSDTSSDTSDKPAKAQSKKKKKNKAHSSDDDSGSENH